MGHLTTACGSLLMALLFVALTVTARPTETLQGPKLPNGKTYCCGMVGGPDCGGPDWTPINFTFALSAATVDVSLTIDSTASKCPGEPCKVANTAVNFPNLASKTDCLGEALRATGALTSDLQVSYDSTADTVTVEVDSEGVMATLQVCT